MQDHFLRLYFPVNTSLCLATQYTCHIRVFCRSSLVALATFLTWCSFSDMRTPGATTFRRRSMSANTHSSLGSVIRKSPLNRACKPYKNDSRLERSKERLSFKCYCMALWNEREVRIRKIQSSSFLARLWIETQARCTDFERQQKKNKTNILQHRTNELVQ